MTTTELPAPKVPGRYHLGFVCSGNICRSPTADVVLRAMGAEVEGLVVDSCGLGDWHVGNAMDERSAALLTAAGYDPDDHRAQHFQRTWFETHDLVLAMDAGHLHDLHRLARDTESTRVRLFGDFDPVNPGVEVPDPYYGGPEGFEEVLEMIERTCAALLPALRDAIAEPSPPR